MLATLSTHLGCFGSPTILVFERCSPYEVVLGSFGHRGVTALVPHNVDWWPTTLDLVEWVGWWVALPCVGLLTSTGLGNHLLFLVPATSPTSLGVGRRATGWWFEGAGCLHKPPHNWLTCPSSPSLRDVVVLSPSPPTTTWNSTTRDVDLCPTRTSIAGCWVVASHVIVFGHPTSTPRVPYPWHSRCTSSFRFRWPSSMIWTNYRGVSPREHQLFRILFHLWITPQPSWIVVCLIPPLVSTFSTTIEHSFQFYHREHSTSHLVHDRPTRVPTW